MSNDFAADRSCAPGHQNDTTFELTTDLLGVESDGWALEQVLDPDVPDLVEAELAVDPGRDRRNIEYVDTEGEALFHERLLGGSRYVLDTQDQVVDDIRVEQFFQLGIGAVDPNAFQRLARLSRIIIHKGDDLVSASCVAVEGALGDHARFTGAVDDDFLSFAGRIAYFHVNGLHQYPECGHRENGCEVLDDDDGIGDEVKADAVIRQDVRHCQCDGTGRNGVEDPLRVLVARIPDDALVDARYQKADDPNAQHGRHGIFP